MPELWAPALLFEITDRLVDVLVQAEVARGGAHADGALAGWGGPLLIFCGPVLELARGYVKGDGLGFSCVEMNAIEGNKRANRELRALWNLTGCA